ncbi:MAG: hypothetical protein OSB69_18155 [Alphaproteobacteria bacterium]|nr:hypothetical protein [Alphaproteobacteria bacterium]
MQITVPDPHHPTFLSNPTHVQAFTTNIFEMMNRVENLNWAVRGVNITMLAFKLDIGFVAVKTMQTYEPSWGKKRKEGAIALEEVREAGKTQLGGEVIDD